MKTGDRIQTLETVIDNGHTIPAETIGIVRVPQIIDGKASVQFGRVIILVDPAQMRCLDIGRQLTAADIQEVYRLRLADLRERYLVELSRYAQAAQHLKRQRDEAIARLNGTNGNGTETAGE